ncbi:GNAT family N-acetyltransferase [Streptomyces sp. NPDC056708]|uniref:GNAT family N-acetyltransferase n=1 Tax=unclassified Streptomyces TaxID=2593676 RepID=UPI0036CB37D0
MAKRTAKKGSSRPVRLSVGRLRKGWPGPADAQVRLATSADTDTVDALLGTAGAWLIPALRSSIEQGTAGAALLDGLDGTTKTFFEDFARRTDGHTMASVSLTLVAADGQDRPIGALSVTAHGTVIERALEHGYSSVQALTLSVAIGKVHGLAVAEEARGQGLASVLLKRAWQVSTTSCCTAPSRPTATWAPSTRAADTPCTPPARDSFSNGSGCPSESMPAPTNAYSRAGGRPADQTRALHRAAELAWPPW